MLVGTGVLLLRLGKRNTGDMNSYQKNKMNMMEKLSQIFKFWLAIVLILTTCTMFALLFKPDKTEVSDDIPKICDHSIIDTEIIRCVDATCTAEGYKDILKTCAKCGEEIKREQVAIAAKGHQNEEYIVGQETATCMWEGFIKYHNRCSVCGNDEFSREVTLDMLPHDYIDGRCDYCGALSP